MLKMILLPSLLAILLTSCATTGPAIEQQPRIVDTGCAWVKPIYISKKDILTEETADSILAHNLTGASHCGWKPKKPTASPQ